MREKIEVILEYFKSLREEIHIRVLKHTRLVWIKILSLGGIISFLMTEFYKNQTNSDINSLGFLIYFVWIIPLVSIIFDMLIACNLRVINNLGHYIKKYIEQGAFIDIKKNITLHNNTIDNETRLEKILDSFLIGPDRLSQWLTGKEDEVKSDQSFGFWEEKVAQANIKYHCYTIADVVVIWLFTPLSLILGCFLWLGSNDGSIFFFIITIVVGFSTLFSLAYLLRSVAMRRQS